MTESAQRDKETRLAALLAADDPPARDPAFVAMVMERMERRPLWELACDGAMTVVGALAVLWALAPALLVVCEDVAALIGPPAPYLFAAGIVAATYWVAVRLGLFAPAFEGEPA